MTDRTTLEYCCERSRRLYNSALSKDNLVTLLDIALDVHMTANWSYDRDANGSEHQEDVKILKYALDNWKEGRKEYSRFDNAVKELIEAALEENEKHLKCIEEFKNAKR